MQSRSLLVLACLFFSGLAALVYQVIWTRLLGFAFGTTTEAIGTVLAVFFGGMAIGNAAAARLLPRVQRPLRVYALLELGIGAFALLCLPVLWRLEAVYAWVGADHGPLGGTLLRVAAAALVLLPPTIAMGATLPVVARALVASDESRGRWSAYLYTANTLGAVAGAYLCGFWLVPALGLGRSVVLAAVVNVAVAVGILRFAPTLRPSSAGPQRASESDAVAGRGWYLAFFGLSGFVAIGYEIVWSKTFSVLMEGTLYGFSTVLSAYLLGIALGSLAISSIVDRVRDLPRLFGALHLAIGVCVATGLAAIPWMPWIWSRLVAWSGAQDILHLAFLVILPVILLPTALFGAAFPVLIRIYTRSADAVGEGMGTAVAVNTAGSIAASLIVGFWWIPSLGSDATLYTLLILDLAVGFLVVFRFQTSLGRERAVGVATASVLLLGVALAYNGAHLDRALVGRWVAAPNLLDYRNTVDSVAARTRLVLEGRHAVVSVHEEKWGRRIRTNGMPESTRAYAEPYNSPEVDLLGILPYLLAEGTARGLVIGFGGGGTLDAMVQTGLDAIEVVELEERVIEAATELYSGVPLPLDDPRVELRVNDGRHHLLLGRHRGGAGYDVIASQPSHPWLAGAANLFTEDFFSLVRDNLREGGVFALWLNGFRIDALSALAVMTSFERVFPGAQLVAAGGESKPWESMILLGGRSAMRWNQARVAERLAEPAAARALGLHGFERPEDLLALFEGGLASFARLEPDLAVTDDNAFLESRIPRIYRWRLLDPNPITERLSESDPVLPPIEGEVDLPYVVERTLGAASGVRPWPFVHRARRLIDTLGEELGERRALRRAQVDLRDAERENTARAALEALAADGPDRAEAHRVLGLHYALQKQDMRAAIPHFEAAHELEGQSQDAFDAARAWHRVDKSRAWAWADRIPAAEREAYPRLALYRAEATLARGGSSAAYESALRELLDYRDTEEGRNFAGVNDAAAQLAARLGRPDEARAFGDASRRRREQAARPVRKELREAIERADFAKAERLVERLESLAPIDLTTLRARAGLARQRGDQDAYQAALREIERWATSPREGRAEVRRAGLAGPGAERAFEEEAPARPSGPGSGARDNRG